MMKNKYLLFFLIIALTAGAILYARSNRNGQNSNVSDAGTVSPVIGDVVLTVSTTGVIQPQNRLEIKPSISGRVEEITVREGDRVRRGDILAWMSSTERAALVDAARSKGEDSLEYWENVYKKTSLISPIDAEVIVRSVEPGQSVTTSDTVLVLSDRLVVSAQFDETDIGRVKVGQKAFITLDAYPDIKLDGLVDHIAYESQIINNVTIYDVDILLEKIPEILRSGMSVSVEVVEITKKDVITVPSKAIHYDGNREFVLVQDALGNTVEYDISIGLNNNEIAEIISGLTTEDTVVIQDKGYLPAKRNSGTNPFMPSRRKKK